ncbi:right-handed parallel beta-helix repeat-containing protein [Halorarum halophilum]|uniref:Right-handed parallel beta-helix repeat-containing protein n=1 Tax=Halorarum halophilum TaxID=2743090 RepID=A0A7D5H1J8_9EURY|nr:NosD domain-containing protein [Halobaculum halophilum]QLG28573.1 right-handed parallel beta-helix repeat-containing protein [Halobaculum halophilum]
MQRGQVAIVTVVVVGAVLVGSAFAIDSTAPPGSDSPRVGADATRIDSCTTITEPGAYVLTTDVENDKHTRLSESCIRIESDDVLFEGDGHVVDGRGISDTRGVTANGTNVTVRNVTVSDWDRGIYYRNVSGGTIEGVNATENGYGIDLDWSREVTIADSDVSGNVIGVDLMRSNDDVELEDNRLGGNHVADVNRNETA